MKEDTPGTRVECVGSEMFHYLVNTFPICCASDEFYYFPQVVPIHTDWEGWDDFSPPRVHELSRNLSRWERELESIPVEKADLGSLGDREVLLHLAKTLREQVTEVRFQESQPTFYLTVACTGLASALEAPFDGAWKMRVKGLPHFLKEAKNSLTRIPSLFRDMGLQMTRDTVSWLSSLDPGTAGIIPALEALDQFHFFLQAAPTENEFLLPAELVERVMCEHTRCGMGLYELRLILEEEIETTRKMMEDEGRSILPGGTWRQALGKIPLPRMPPEGAVALYRGEIENLLSHCIDRGIVSGDLPRASPVTVSEVPDYLAAVRAASSYSFSPGGTFQGGTFFVVPRGMGWDNSREDLVDYRMLTAHETYPGHHLLDSSRWSIDRNMRRPVEAPLFYEGWACFGEELMRLTDYFSGPEDQMLLAKRRYRRALRGLTDLNLQTRKFDIDGAARHLVGALFTKDTALSVVPKYLLRPGYQICYTLGLKRFMDLHIRYGCGNPGRFARTVLSQGEVTFDHLERVFAKENENQRSG